MTSIEPVPREPTPGELVSAVDSPASGGRGALTRTVALLVVLPPLLPGIIGALVLLLWAPTLPHRIVTQWDVDGTESSTLPLWGLILFTLALALFLSLVFSLPAALVVRGTQDPSPIATMAGTGAGFSAATITLILSSTVMQRDLDGLTWAGSVLPILVCGGVWIVLAVLATSRLRRLVPRLRDARAARSEGQAPGHCE